MKFSFPSVLLIAILASQTFAVHAANPSRVNARIDNARRVRLAGHLRPSATEENDIGALDETTTLPALTMTLRPAAEQEAELVKLLAEQQDPASPNYHQWLTPEQFADRFGVSSDDID